MGTVGRARQCARNLIKKHAVRSVPIDVLGLIGKEAPGYRIIYEENWPDRLSGLTNKAQKIIRINKKHHPLRQRFSLAHELGHVCLDHDLVLAERIEGEDVKNEIEKEADEFAAEPSSGAYSPRDFKIKVIRKVRGFKSRMHVASENRDTENHDLKVVTSLSAVSGSSSCWPWLPYLAKHAFTNSSTWLCGLPMENNF